MLVEHDWAAAWRRDLPDRPAARAHAPEPVLALLRGPRARGAGGVARRGAARSRRAASRASTARTCPPTTSCSRCPTRTARRAARRHRRRAARRSPTASTRARSARSPPPDGPPTLLYTGTLDYAPNAEGLRWLLREVWPRVVARRPRRELLVVGRNPPEDARRLRRRRGDVHRPRRGDRALLRRAPRAVLVPLLSGGGTKLKVLDGLASGRPVVSTSVGVEGIAAEDGRAPARRRRRRGVRGRRRAGARGRGAARTGSGAEGRALAEQRYDWHVLSARFEQILEVAASEPALRRASSPQAPLERKLILAVVREAAAAAPAGARVLDAGAGDAPYRELFAHTDYKTTDWTESVHPGARSRRHHRLARRAAGRGRELRRRRSARRCSSTCPSRRAVLAELRRVLRDGGELWLTVPFVGELHEEPHDHFRYTSHGLRGLCERAGFGEVRTWPLGGYFTAMAQLARNCGPATGVGTGSRRARAAAARGGFRGVARALPRLDRLDRRRALPIGFALPGRRSAGAARARRARRGAAAGSAAGRTAPARRARLASPSRRRSSASATSASSLSASAGGSCGRTSRSALPATSISDPESPTSTGSPQPIASISAKPNCSRQLRVAALASTNTSCAR